jgi:hypothetical protein
VPHGSRRVCHTLVPTTLAVPPAPAKLAVVVPAPSVNRRRSCREGLLLGTGVVMATQRGDPTSLAERAVFQMRTWGHEGTHGVRA